ALVCMRHRRPQGLHDVIDMDPGEDLPRLVDPVRTTGPDRLERTATGAVDARQPEHVDRCAAPAAERAPAFLGSQTPSRPFAARLRRRALLHPASGMIAIDAGRRQIA